MNKKILSMLMVAVLFLSSCTGGGPLSKLDSTLDYAPFFFDGLVIAGQISQERSDFYKRGVVRGETIADATKLCLSDNGRTDAECYVQLGNDVRAMVNEFYPKSTEGKVAQFAALLTDVVNLIIQKNTPSVGVGGPTKPVTDKQIENKIDELDKLLHSEDGAVRTEGISSVDPS